MFLKTSGRCPAHWFVNKANYVEDITARSTGSFGEGSTATESKVGLW